MRRGHFYSTIAPMEPKNQGFWGVIKETVRFVIITVLIVVPFRLFIAQPFIVSGDSMVPTFHNSEYLIVDELSYYLREPSRGEVVIFRYPKEPSKFFIKRIVGLPGETVAIKNNHVEITKIGGTRVSLTEPYVKTELLSDMSVILANDEYFVMGDNRNASSDSRFWGPVTRPLIIGRAFARLLPIAQAEMLPGKSIPLTTPL